MLSVDPTEAKLEVERRLQIEEESVEWLADKIRQSTELTSTMTGVLTSFEERLTKLEATILPVYQETENLQRRQENIDKTLEALDHVIDFYNVSKDVEATVRAGPSSANNLEEFLATMSRLRSSLDYFEKSNPQSIELENIKALYETGGDALSREFRELVNKNSVTQPAVDLLNAISMPEEATEVASIHYFPEDVQSSLSSIAEWLNFNNRDEFMNVYGAVRSQCMKKSLESLRDHAKTSSAGGNARSSSSPSILRKFSSPIVANEGTPTSANKNYIKSINRKLTNVTTKLEAATGLSRRSLGTPSAEHDRENALYEMEVEAFILILSALQHLMASEQQLMVGIIPHQYQKGTFEIISRESLDLVIRDADAIIGRVKKASSSNDFLAIISVFQVVKHLQTIKPSMDRILEVSDPGIRAKYNNMTHSFFVTGSNALDSFVDGIRADPTTREKMPKDGTVFQLTSNVILFLEQLLEFVDTLAMILTQDTSYNQTLLRLPRKISVSERTPALVGLYIKKVLVQLNLTLVNKSDYYSDQFLKAVFRLNNNQFILKSIQRSGLMTIVSLAEPDCEANYNDMIREQKMLYSNSWARVLNYIWNAETDIPNAVLMAPGKLNDKYARIIKEKFDGVNKEFKDISLTQRMYSIPDVELRESLKRDNKEFICPKYNSFYEKYAGVPFTKHPEKYVKYTPAEVSSQIDSFFDAAA
jgi:exocyst complex protein 7